MRFHLKIVNILFLIFSSTSFLLYLEYKNTFFLYLALFCFISYFIFVEILLININIISKKMKNLNNFNNKKIKPYLLHDTIFLFNSIRSFFSKYQLIEAVNLTLSKNSHSDQFYKAVVENVGLIFNTPHLGFFLYDPVIEKCNLMHGNGIFSTFSKDIDFKNLDQINSNIIYKSEFPDFFFKDIDSLKSIGVFKLHTPLNYTAYILFAFNDYILEDSFFEEYSSLSLEIQTAFSLYINNQKLKGKIDDLNLLNKINTLMEKNRNVDEVMHLFLTHITANEGLGFNRAIMFEKKHNNLIQGVRSIGPLTKDEADEKWNNLKSCPIDLFLEQDHNRDQIIEPLEKLIKSTSLNLETDPVLKSIILSRKAKIMTLDKSGFSKNNKRLLKKLNLNYFIIVPMICYEKFLGFILVDNIFDLKAFSDDRVNSLISFTTQTSLVIHNLSLYNQVKNMAIRDELTQLYNRRYFSEKLNSEIERSLRNKKSFSIIMIDVDFFKNYNDLNGHIAGDTLLTVISNIFLLSCRKLDVVCRCGGEEFVILLPDTDENGAYLLAEKIRKKVFDNVFPYEENQPDSKLTISLGISSFPENITDPKFLLEAADQALYHSKKTGRNKVSCYSKI